MWRGCENVFNEKTKQLNVKYYLNFNKNYKEAKYDSRRLRYGRWELCLRCVCPNVDRVDTVLLWDNIQMEIHSVARFSLSIRKYDCCQISFIEAMLTVKRDAVQGMSRHFVNVLLFFSTFGHHLKIFSLVFSTNSFHFFSAGFISFQ